MSYGRKPYYIYESSDGFNFMGQDCIAVVPYDAMAQFIASLVWRGEGEIKELIERGLELRPILKDKYPKLSIEE